MGKGRPREVEKGVLLGNSYNVSSTDMGSMKVPSGPVYYPNEEEFMDPLGYINKIKPEAEPYGICKIVPPSCWNPPFALDRNSFTFPTKTQAIHQLQARCASCDPKTFALEYNHFMEKLSGRKAKKRVVFEGEDLDLCKLFNVVKRFGGYDMVSMAKKWGEVFRFVQPEGKISECSKHVLSQLYRENLHDYEKYCGQLNRGKNRRCKRDISDGNSYDLESELSGYKRKRKHRQGEKVEAQKQEEVFDQICEQCRSGLHEEVMLLCDRCNKGWHLYCLSPPLKRIPPGNWYCLECLNSEKDSFGFMQGKQFSLEAFSRVAERVKKKWFGSANPSRVQLEKKFWEIVDGFVGKVEVMYGSDLDTSVYGSGFPRPGDKRPEEIDVETWNKYCSNPWNLNNLPTLQGSMLRAVRHNIAGVMVPWLYIGMLFSSFCWHFEDHCFYSMNYLHWGEPKCWYSVPGNDAHSFEKVMRGSLPDLFDAQPDLLFQLVTMLNPSVLVEKGVPVYSIIQEPGNFVITFPRSYHGGFNFGLNCAEAVNFAPADWLPHGGFGAKLYRHYHKAAVLSHEELLYVVSKGEIDCKSSPYLKKELLGVYNQEKTWRERLWRNGIIKSFLMAPRKQPEYVGAEEDPMCIICRQFLFLSAVACNCRPSTFVCLEHWEHLCECRPNNLRLFYRHTLAELYDLLLAIEKHDFDGTNDALGGLSSGNAIVLSKKVKGGRITHTQLAEEWIFRACKVLENPYSKNAYDSAIEEADQFLWAGYEMDLVRNMRNNMLEAQIWAEAVRKCVYIVKTWSKGQNRGTPKLQLDHINELVRLSNPPCNEPDFIHLKEYQKEATDLLKEINSALSMHSDISMNEWEILCAKAFDSPIYLKESENLKIKLSDTKTWLDNVRHCINQKSSSSIEIDTLDKLEMKIFELQLQFPEAELLGNLIKKAKSCLASCSVMLKDPVSVEEIRIFLGDWEDFTVAIPELNLLRKYYDETMSWKFRVNCFLTNIHEREDQENVVNELIIFQREGSLLHVQVDELPRIELELEKASCRVKALKALGGKMSMDFIKQLMLEAAILQMENEMLFTDISQRLAVAICWEEKAKYLLENKAKMFEFDDIIRASEDNGVILPSCNDILDAISLANAWLTKSKPFLSHHLSGEKALDSRLQLDILKDLVLESEHLKICCEESSLLIEILKKCNSWEQDASSLLRATDELWIIDIFYDKSIGIMISKFECQVISIESAMKVGESLGIDFPLLSKLQDTCSLLSCFRKALSLSLVIPTSEEVGMVLDDAVNLSTAHASCPLLTILIDGLNWLKKALEFLDPHTHGLVELSRVQEALVHSKEKSLSFPMIINRLHDAIDNHNSWLEKFNQFFGLDPEERSWTVMIEIKDDGDAKAFRCTELLKVLSEVDKIEHWRRNCEDLLKPFMSKEIPLISSLVEIEHSLEQSLDIYNDCMNGVARTSCACGSSNDENQEVFTCSVCRGSHHWYCAKQACKDAIFVYPYCTYKDNSKVPRGGFCSLRTCHLELEKLVFLLSDADDHCLWIEERRILHKIIEKALACNKCLTELVDFALANVCEDISIVSEKLCIALKATNVAAVLYGQERKKLELALARNSWRMGAEQLLRSSDKPTLQQIQHCLKEGLGINILPEDYYRLKLLEARDMGLRWINSAKKVAADGGLLELNRVFDLILEGENLPVSCGKDLKLLRDRSMLYCICRRPYDQKAMIACDKCDEWYHFECIRISLTPKVYICPACTINDLCASSPTEQDRYMGSLFEEPHTPSRHTELRRNLRKSKHVSVKDFVNVDISSVLKNLNSVDRLFWRSRKPFRRTVRKRSQLQNLSPFGYVHNL